MPFEVKIRPVDFQAPVEPARIEPVKSVPKSRFKRLFEKQFASVVRVSSPVPVPVPENISPADTEETNGNGGVEVIESSTALLGRLIQNFYEGSSDRRCGRNRCNCFNHDGMDSSDDDVDSCSCFGESNHNSFLDACETLKCLVGCVSVTEGNLLAEIARIVEKNKISIQKNNLCRKIVTDSLIALGYNASICKSRWEKISHSPAGEYEYVDVLIDGERFIVDIDLKSEFEIARPTKKYRTYLQILPVLFVGKEERLQKIISVVCDQVKQSLKKRGMSIPPWRKVNYMKSKWFSEYTRVYPEGKEDASKTGNNTESLSESELIFGKKGKKSFESIFGKIDEVLEEEEEEEEEVEMIFAMSNSPEKNEVAMMAMVEKEKPLKNMKMAGLSIIMEEDEP